MACQHGKDEDAWRASADKTSLSRRNSISCRDALGFLCLQLDLYISGLRLWYTVPPPAPGRYLPEHATTEATALTACLPYLPERRSY